MADSISRQFARWTANLRYEDLPPAVVDKVKALLLHALTSAVLGGATANAKDAIALTKAEEGKPDGATILTDGGKATRIGATFADAELMHSSLLFDSYRMLTHPGPVLVPAAMVNAELEGRDGKEVITALAAGYEFLFRLCDDVIPSTAARGFRPSPLYCTMGAALVTGKLMGLDEEGLVATIALAANFASGLNEGPRAGGNETSIHEPQAARNGVFAGVIGRTGHIHGAERSIEGEAGFYNAFTGSHTGKLSYTFTGPLQADLGRVTGDLGVRYNLLTAMFRMYPTAGYNQPVIDLMAEMKRQHNLNPDDIAEVTVAMNWIETLYPSPAFPRFPDWNTPRVGGTHFFAAHAAVNGGYPVVGARSLGPGGVRPEEDQGVLDFMASKVRLVQETDRPMFSPGITVTMKDGTVHRGEYPYARMEWDLDQLVARLMDCLPGYALGTAGFTALVAAVRGAEDLPSVERLIEVTRLP
ncbi:MAG: MmgE/PrpD family protein [Dehalococcoidia bacterium]